MEQKDFESEKKILPFRLTPNFVDFIGHIGLNGLFAGVMTSCSLAVAKHADKINCFISLALKDDFFGHQNAVQTAVKIMLAQGTGGALLFNASKQAVSPGHSFGAYGLPKAATLFLSRQYALEYGSVGIRSNAVNADRIRSGLMTDAMIEERAAARKVDPAAYLAGNLLGAEVTAEDVAQAFLHQALALKTTASVTTVDGGNIAAALR